MTFTSVWVDPRIDEGTLDPEFVTELQAMANLHSDNQASADDDKWNIARKVNEMYGEHKSIFPTRLEYYIECTRVINLTKRRKYLSDSGETLRRWCETVATYTPFESEVERGRDFLDILTFDHLYKAKRLYLKEKVKSPFLALAEAARQNFTADEMQYHFDPPTKPDEWDVMTERVQAMKTKEFWKVKHPQNAKRIIEHVNQIEAILQEDRE